MALTGRMWIACTLANNVFFNTSIRAVPETVELLFSLSATAVFLVLLGCDTVVTHPSCLHLLLSTLTVHPFGSS